MSRSEISGTLGSASVGAWRDGQHKDRSGEGRSGRGGEGRNGQGEEGRDGAHPWTLLRLLLYRLPLLGIHGPETSARPDPTQHSLAPPPANGGGGPQGCGGRGRGAGGGERRGSHIALRLGRK